MPTHGHRLSLFNNGSAQRLRDFPTRNIRSINRVNEGFEFDVLDRSCHEQVNGFPTIPVTMGALLEPDTQFRSQRRLLRGQSTTAEELLSVLPKYGQGQVRSFPHSLQRCGDECQGLLQPFCRPRKHVSGYFTGKSLEHVFKESFINRAQSNPRALQHQSCQIDRPKK